MYKRITCAMLAVLALFAVTACESERSLRGGESADTTTVTTEAGSTTSTTQGSTTSVTAVTTTTVTDDDKAAEDLRVRPEDILPGITDCASDKFLDNSLRPVKLGDPESLQWSDAVSTPFVEDGKDPEKWRKGFFTENCGNPTALEMYLNAFKTINATPTFNIGTENPWMGECLAKVEDADGSLREAFLTKKTGQSGVYVTEEFTLCAELFNTFFLAFQYSGLLENPTSVESWHVDKRTAGELPHAELSLTQENLPAFVFDYTIKAGCATLRIGFNALDKRFERFQVPCDQPPGCTQNCGTTPSTTGGKQVVQAPASTVVVICLSGQQLDRDTNRCVPVRSGTLPDQGNPTGGDSGVGAPGEGAPMPTPGGNQDVVSGGGSGGNTHVTDPDE